MTFRLRTLSKDCPEYIDCETLIDIGFSGLIAYWKPQTMVNLLEFINENQEPPKKQPSQSKKERKPKDATNNEKVDQEVLDSLTEIRVTGNKDLVS